MSGSIGGSRIKRKDVQPTLDKYEEQVLKGFPGYESYAITGSYNAGTRADHGDIDIVLYIKHNNIVKLKSEFRDYLNSLPDNVTVPFRWGKRIGDKSQLFGNLVTCAFPIAGSDNEYVQIDNMMVCTAEDARFLREFMNLDAQHQALFQGIARVLIQQGKGPAAFKHFGLTDLPEPGPNQEYEFVLSPNGLSLRLVTLSGFKETGRVEVWRSNNWSDVEWLMSDYDMHAPFEETLQTVAKKIKDDRSHRRIYGVMKSMIRIGPGEVGTPKGDAKQQGIDRTKEVLNVKESLSSLSEYLKEHLN